MSTKKFGIVAGIAMALSVVVSPAFAACSLTTLSECDNTGLMALVAQLLAGTSSTSTTTTGAAITGIPSGFTFTTNLKQGTTSNDVKYLQILLNSDSATSIGNAGKETTYFGAMTKAAVVKFQNKYASEVLAPYGLTAGTGVFGTASRAKANALIASGTTTTTTTGTGTTTTTTATGAYTVSLSGTQASGTLGSSSAYNKVLNINVVAGATAQSITSVTVQRTGLSTDSYVDGVMVVDANGNRHGNVVTFGNGVATINFASDPITVAAGATTTISIQLNMSSTATGGTLGVSLTGMTGTPAGLPLASNTFTLVSAASTLGQVTTTVEQVSATDAVQQNIGSTGYIISKIKVAEGGTEDVYLKKLTLYQNGSAADGDITNIKLVALDGTVLSTVASTTNRYVTFDLSANPYKIGKGVTKYFNIIIDITSGSSRTVQFVVQNNYDVVLTGASSQLSLLTGPTSGFPAGTSTNFNTVLIGAGQITVSKDSTTPSGTVGIAASNTTVATWSFKATGEDIELRQVKLWLSGLAAASTNKLSGTVKLVTDDGQTIYTGNTSAFYTYASSTYTYGVNPTVTLSSYYTIPAGTTKKISLVVDTSSNITTTDYLLGGISDIYYKKVSTGSFATTSSTAIYGNSLNIGSAALTVVSNGSFGSGSIVAGSSAVRIGSFLLQTTSIDGVNVSSLSLKIGSSNSAAPALSNLQLKRADTGEYIGNAISSPSVGYDASSPYTTITFPTSANTFSVSGQLNISASSTVQVDVYADIPTAASGYYLQAEITNVGATGVNSGTDVSSSNTITGQTPGVTTGGTLTASIETSSAASSQFLTTGLSGVELSKIKFAATVEDMKIDRLEVRTINGSGNVSSIKLLNSSLSTDPVAYLAGDTAVFALSTPIVIPAYSSRVLTLVADTTNVGTLKGSQLVAIGFGTANAKGSSSGNIVQESLTGTATTVASADDYAVVAGDIIYFTNVAAGGDNTAPGYYVVTSADTVNPVSDGIVFNGESNATKFNVGDNITKLSKAGADVADGSGSQSYAKGDIIYFYNADAGAGEVATGWHIVYATATTPTTGGTISIDGGTSTATAITLEAGDIVTKFTNVNALVGNTMQMTEVEPTLAKNTSSPSGTLSPQADQIVAMFDVTAAGSRDLTLNTFTVQQSGSYTPSRYVTTWNLYNGSTLIDAADNSKTSTVDASGHASITSAEFVAGDVITIVNATHAAVTTYTLTSTDISHAYITTGVESDVVSMYSNNIHFATAQTITAGQTMTLTVKADTSLIRTPVSSGTTATLTVSVPGTAGPLTTAVGGMDWSYGALGSSSTSFSGVTGSDSYPVNANTLSY